MSPRDPRHRGAGRRDPRHDGLGVPSASVIVIPDAVSVIAGVAQPDVHLTLPAILADPATTAHNGICNFRKDPADVLDYDIDWSEWLQTEAEKLVDIDSSDVITASVWTLPAEITKHFDARDNRSTLIWLSGGTAGNTYVLANRITTSGGRQDERSIEVIMEQR